MVKSEESFQYTGVEYTEGRGINFSMLNEEHPMPPEYLELRSQILREFPEKPKTINLDRVNSFFAESGLPETDMVFIKSSDVPRLTKLMGSDTVPDESGYRDLAGRAYPFLKLFVVVISTEETKINPENLEGIIAHEKAHAATTLGTNFEITVSRRVLGKSESVHPSEAGFVGENRPGLFFEEMFAEMTKGRFTAKNRPSEVSASVRNTILRDFSYLKDEIEQVEKYFIPSIDNFDDLQLTPSFLPAFVGEQICKRKPEFYELMKSARTNTAALDELNKVIHSIFGEQLTTELREYIKTPDKFRDMALKMINVMKENP